MKIWCLFSVDNNYDQPDNNLFAWWAEKPSLEVLAQTLTGKPLGELEGEDILQVVEVFTGRGEGKVKRFHFDTTFRLEEVADGKLS
jgi:hypothetical protein